MYLLIQAVPVDSHVCHAAVSHGHQTNLLPAMLSQPLLLAAQVMYDKPDAPSNFTLKLRKHLRTRRLEDVRQLGVDRRGLTLSLAPGKMRTTSSWRCMLTGQAVLLAAADVLGIHRPGQPSGGGILLGVWVLVALICVAVV